VVYCHIATIVETGQPSWPNANSARARERERSAAYYVLQDKHHYQWLTELNCILYEEKLFQIKYSIDRMPAPLTAGLSLTALNWRGWEQVSFGSKQKGSCKSYLFCNLFLTILWTEGEKNKNICKQICYDQTILYLHVVGQLYIGVYICSSLPNK